MGRPRGSFQNKQLALEFAETVTVASDSPASKVARAGSYSIFEVFAQCCPWAVRFHGGGALDGLTILEFNKLLESHDFLKVRRSAPPPGYTDNFADPSNPDYTGAYAFAKLRWRDPLDPEDCAELVEGRRSLQVLFCEGNRILDEENFLARILEAKLGTDRLECNLSQSATPRSGTPTWDRHQFLFFLLFLLEHRRSFPELHACPACGGRVSTGRLPPHPRGLCAQADSGA
eukprot:1989860-Rhodomonas_salina.1